MSKHFLIPLVCIEFDFSYFRYICLPKNFLFESQKTDILYSISNKLTTCQTQVKFCFCGWKNVYHKTQSCLVQKNKVGNNDYEQQKKRYTTCQFKNVRLKLTFSKNLKLLLYKKCMEWIMFQKMLGPSTKT